MTGNSESEIAPPANPAVSLSPPLLGVSLPAGFPMASPVTAAESYRVTVAAPSASTDWWVDANAGSDGNDGKSAAKPWKTLDKLHSAVLKPGDVIHLARGSVWKNQSLMLDYNYSGTAANPITFQAYGTGNAPTISEPRALWDKNKEFAGIAIGGTAGFIRILDIRVQETSQCAGISMGITTHDIVIAGCEAVRCNTGVSLAGDRQKIIGNFIHDIGSAGGMSGIGICFEGNDLEIGWNRIENCQARSAVGDLGVDGGALEYYNYRSDLGYNFVSNNIRIHHNVICACLNFMEAYGNATGMKIDYNVYLNGPNEALEFHFDDCEHPVWTITPTYEVAIENNTFVPNKNDRKVGWGLIGLLVDGTSAHNPDPAKNKIAIRNNLFVTNYRVVAFKNVLGGSLIHDHNMYWMTDGAIPSNDKAGFVLGSTDRLFDATHAGNPGFANALNYDFRLASGSAAIDAGVVTGTGVATVDILGNAVPAGGAPDIGAYEYR